MQKVVYRCDHCSKEFGEKRHISLRFAENSGIATPPTENGNGPSYWHCSPDIRGKFIHLCNATCLAAWFKKLMETPKIIKKGKKK